MSRTITAITIDTDVLQGEIDAIDGLGGVPVFDAQYDSSLGFSVARTGDLTYSSDVDYTVSTVAGGKQMTLSAPVYGKLGIAIVTTVGVGIPTVSAAWGATSGFAVNRVGSTAAVATVDYILEVNAGIYTLTISNPVNVTINTASASVAL